MIPLLYRILPFFASTQEFSSIGYQRIATPTIPPRELPTFAQSRFRQRSLLICYQGYSSGVPATVELRQEVTVDAHYLCR
jgi:hypothetical protein